MDIEGPHIATLSPIKHSLNPNRSATKFLVRKASKISEDEDSFIGLSIASRGRLDQSGNNLVCIGFNFWADPLFELILPCFLRGLATPRLFPVWSSLPRDAIDKPMKESSSSEILDALRTKNLVADLFGFRLCFIGESVAMCGPSMSI